MVIEQRNDLGMSELKQHFEKFDRIILYNNGKYETIKAVRDKRMNQDNKLLRIVTLKGKININVYKT